jgi:protein subunit release factor B
MISESKWKAIEARMTSLGIFEKDLEEHFVRSGGHGGQNVNKVSTCVYLKHLPSGLEVKCQESRYQIDNRYFARRILCEKMDSQIHGKRSAEARERHKIRKQKKKRSKRSKEKILKDKHQRSEKKGLRQRPSYD